MKKTIIALTAATAIFCSPFVYADDDSDGASSDNATTEMTTSTSTTPDDNNATSTDNNATSTDDNATDDTAPKGTNVSTTTTTTEPGNSIEDLATSPSTHVNIQLKTADGKMINAVVHPSDLVGLKSGESVQLTVPSEPMTSTSTTITKP